MRRYLTVLLTTLAGSALLQGIAQAGESWTR